MVPLIGACHSTTPFIAPDPDREETAPPAGMPVYQVFLVGNAGAGELSDVAPTLSLLQAQLAHAGERSAVVFLGDTVPCCGMPGTTAETGSGKNPIICKRC